MVHPCHGAFGPEFSDAEIEALLARLESAFQRRKGESPGGDERAQWREAIEEAGREQIRENLIEARLARHTALARDRRAIRFAELEAGGLTPDRALAAFNVGSEKGVAGAGNSVDARGQALEDDMLGRAYLALKEAGVLDRMSKWHGGRDLPFERQVVEEMARLNGHARARETGNADAVRAAEILNGMIEEGRLIQNSQGAWISKLPGYITRQTHDPMKISGGFFRGMNRSARERARADWIDYILPRLDEASFDAIRAERARRQQAVEEIRANARIRNPEKRLAEADPDGFAAMNDDQLKRAYLQGIWNDIVTGRHDVWDGAVNDLDAARSSYRPPASRARTVSAGRVLHFADPGAWFEYNQKYGRGSLMDAFDGQVRRAARNTALMEAWGPAPRAAFDAHVEAQVSAARDAGDVKTVQGLSTWLRRAEFEQLDGSADAPESVRMAAITRGILINQQMSKLGGMVISSMTDTTLAANALRRAGVDYLDSYKGLYSSVLHMDGAVGREVSDNLGVAARVMAGDMTSRFGAIDGYNGLMGRMSGIFYKANLFTWWSSRIRRGAGVIVSRHLANNADTAYGALSEPTRTQLARYGINEGLWDIYRAKVSDFGEEGRFLTMDAARDVDAEAVARAIGLREGEGGFTPSQLDEARTEAHWRLQAYFSDQAENAMTEPRARERAAIRGGQQAGTPVDMALRLFMQFKTFPTTVLTRQLFPAVGGANGLSPIATTAHLILMGTVLGFVAMQAKMLARGLTPRPLTDEDGNPRVDTFIAAMLQGGGLGIYGDLIMADANRYGQGLADTLGGPAVGEITAMWGVVAALRDAAIHGEQTDVGAQVFNLARRNTPFANLFYTKAALDYFLIYQMQERVSPGYLDRYEQRLEREQGVRFLVPPSEVVD